MLKLNKTIGLEDQRNDPAAHPEARQSLKAVWRCGQGKSVGKKACNLRRQYVEQCDHDPSSLANLLPVVSHSKYTNWKNISSQGIVKWTHNNSTGSKD